MGAIKIILNNTIIHHHLVLLAILAACAGPVLILAGKVGWPEVPRPAFNPWLLSMMTIIMMSRMIMMKMRRIV